MTIHQFIFSKERNHRLARHLVFWSTYCLVAFYSEFQIGSLNELKAWKTYRWNLKFFGLFLPMTVFMVYVFIYVLIPKFLLPKKYFAFIVAALGTILFCFAVDMIPAYIIHFNYPYPPATEAGMRLLYFAIDYQHSVHRNVCLAVGITCIALSKEWYFQQIENTRLAKLDAENRTRLLKSQIQPEFLFHSLQSLYKKLKNYPDEAPGMVVTLSDIFSYILYDSNEKYVLLEKELLAIQNFLLTEKMNKENNTKINMHIRGNGDNKYIVPLTLFSFFGSRLDTGTGEISIDISIDIKDSMLSLVIQFKNQSSNHTENIQMDNPWEKWHDQLPDNFTSYYISSNNAENNFTIDAVIPLAGISAVENIHYQSLAAN